MKESQIQSKIMAYLKTRPGSYTIKISDRLYHGIPDILHIENTSTYFFEVKTEKGKLSKIQDHTIKQLQKAGALCFVVKSLKDVQRELEPT